MTIIAAVCTAFADVDTPLHNLITAATNPLLVSVCYIRIIELCYIRIIELLGFSYCRLSVTEPL